MQERESWALDEVSLCHSRAITGIQEIFILLTIPTGIQEFMFLTIPTGTQEFLCEQLPQKNRSFYVVNNSLRNTGVLCEQLPQEQLVDPGWSTARGFSREGKGSVVMAAFPMIVL